MMTTCSHVVIMSHWLKCADQEDNLLEMPNPVESTE